MGNELENMMGKDDAPAVWPMVTVNILAYNRREEVRTTLNKVINDLDYPKDRYEVIVVDNESSDGTKEMVAAEFPQVKLLVIEKNCGIAGWNRGFREGRGDYFFVLDDDSAPLSGLKDAVAYLEQHPAVGVLGCEIVGGAFVTKNVKDESNLAGFVGAGVIIRRGVIEATGGYADWIYVQTHEPEFVVRCLDAGYQVKHFKRCVVHHRGPLRYKSFERVRTYSTRNELMIVYKYFSRRRLLLFARTLAYHLIASKKEGLQSYRYVLKGLIKFLQDAAKQKKQYVKRDVQDFYTNAYWSTQPVIPFIIKRAANGPLSPLPEYTEPDFHK